MPSQKDSPNTLLERLRWCVLETRRGGGFDYEAQLRRDHPGQWPGKARIVALLLDERAAKLVADALRDDAAVGWVCSSASII